MNPYDYMQEHLRRSMDEFSRQREEYLFSVAMAGIDPRVVRWSPVETRLEGNMLSISQTSSLPSGLIESMVPAE